MLIRVKSLKGEKVNSLKGIFRVVLLIYILFCSLKCVFADEITLKTKVGEEFQVVLPSNPTTGFRWALGKKLDKNKISLVSSDYVPSKPQLTGSGGNEVWIFKAVKSGKTKILFEYSRSWEKGKISERKIYNIEIKE